MSNVRLRILSAMIEPNSWGHFTPEKAEELLASRDAEAAADAESRAARYRIAWRRARTRALSTGSAANRYAARARELQTALQDSVFAFLAMQMERDAVRAKALAEAADKLDGIADETEAKVAQHYGAASGIGPGSADMVREAASTVRGMAGKDTRGSSQLPAGESTQSDRTDVLAIRWDRTVIHPKDDPTEPTIVLCSVADTGQPVALYLDDEHREALGLLLVDPDGEMDQAEDGPAAPDFFQPGRTYVRDHHGEPILFAVGAVATGPGHTYPTAFGWRKVPGEDWEPSDSDDMGGWTALDLGESAPTAPDFFQPGHGYTRLDGSDFRCVAVTTHPNTGERRALGWIVRNGWHEGGALDPDDWTQYDGYEPPADTEAGGR